MATFLFYLGFQMLIPVMPLYAAHLGAGEGQIGLIIGVFAFSAMFLRPVTGELADRIGRYPLVLAGSAIFAAAAIAYPALGRSISALIAIRLFHGIGMGLGPTAGTVMVADLAPPHRRGEAMGLYGMTGNASLVIAPYLGAALLERGGFAPAFAGSAGLELVSLLVASRLPETRPPAPRTPRHARSAAGWLAGFFHAGALYPSLLVFLLFFPFGAVFTFVPLFARQQQMANIGPFFTAFALSAVIVRGLAGRLTDRIGRRMVAAPQPRAGHRRAAGPRPRRRGPGIHRGGRAPRSRIRRGPAGDPRDDGRSRAAGRPRPRPRDALHGPGAGHRGRGGPARAVGGAPGLPVDVPARRGVHGPGRRGGGAPDHAAARVNVGGVSEDPPDAPRGGAGEARARSGTPPTARP